MYLTASVVLVVMRYALASEEQNCTERCSVCYQGKCTRCYLGFYGDNCTRECGTHCLGGKCWSNLMCSYGCEDGWYGLNCDKPCRRQCREGKCDRFSGYCGWYVPSKPDPPTDSCANGHCSDDCPGNCPSEDKTMTIEVVLVIAGAVVAFFVVCACCMVKKKVICTDSASKNRHELEIIPHRQQLVRGHNPTSFTSANVVHSFRMPRYDTNSEGGDDTHPPATAPTRVMEEPPPSYELVSGATAPSARHMEQPPPSYEHACRTDTTNVPV